MCSRYARKARDWDLAFERPAHKRADPTELLRVLKTEIRPFRFRDFEHFLAYPRTVLVRKGGLADARLRELWSLYRLACLVAVDEAASFDVPRDGGPGGKAGFVELFLFSARPMRAPDLAGCSAAVALKQAAELAFGEANFVNQVECVLVLFCPRRYPGISYACVGASPFVARSLPSAICFTDFNPLVPPDGAAGVTRVDGPAEVQEAVLARFKPEGP